MSPLRASLLAFSAIALLACGSEVHEPAPSAPVLEPLPRPELARAAPEVARQLEERRSEIDAEIDAGTATAEDFGEIAELYHAYDLLVPAAAAYRNALALEPETFRWHYLLGYLHELAGRGIEAAEALRSAIELEAGDAPAHYRLGRIELERSQLEGDRLELAEKAFERTLELDPRCAGAVYGLAEVARLRGRDALAAERYARVLELDPSAAQVHYPLGQALLKLDRRQEAEEQIRLAAEREYSVGSWPECRDPLVAALAGRTSGAAAHIQRGLSALSRGGGEQALREFRLAVEADPEDPSARTHLAAELQRRGELAGALEHFRTALRLDPANPRIHYDLASLLENTGAQAEALELFRSALELDPAFAEAHLALATALQRGGRLEEALAHYDRVLEEDPQNLPARLQRAIALAGLERIADARGALEEVVADFPGLEPEERLNAASAFALVGDLDRASELLEILAAGESEPGVVARALANLGLIDLRRGRPGPAAERFRAALELDPDLPQARQGLAMAQSAGAD